jgi:hypothetical protein
MPQSKAVPPKYPQVGPRTSEPKQEEGSFALALGGLAGNNAHGAGVIEALYRNGKKPKLITCTSGQIRYVHAYLCGLKQGSTLNPYTLLKKHFETAQPFSDLTDPNLNFKLLTWPIQQIRPAVPEFSRDITKNLTRSMREFFKSPATFSMWRELYKMMPARSLVSQDLILHPELFNDISDLFNDDSHGIGIIFNAYDFVEGHEHVFMNDKAAELTGHTPGTNSNSRDWVRYRAITPEAVRDALRLYEYGFDLPGNLIDGAYLRGLILNEIPHANNGISTIVVGRPLTSRWLGDAPSSLTELRDMQTEVNFHGSYLGEKGHIELINQLIESNHPVPPPSGATHIDFLEVEMDRQRGWWEYVLECEDVFNSAFHHTLATVVPKLSSSAPAPSPAAPPVKTPAAPELV